MLYVIPCIILLIVAIILKKWEMGKAKQASANKANAKRNSKKVTRKTVNHSHAETRKVSPTTLAEPAKTTPISQELHQKIVSLIQAESYSAAEAEINHALNHDNSQHGLYLYLLDIHILQKDDFAINQLIKHLRILNLQAIIMQAEAKNREYKQQNQPDSIKLSSTSNSFNALSNQPKPPVAASHAAVVSNADFDTFIDSAEKNSETAFVVADTIEMNQENLAKIEAQELHFSFSPQVKESEQTPNTLAVLPDKQANSTQFSFTLEPREVSNHHIETAQNIEFDISPVPLTETTLPKVSLDLAAPPPLESEHQNAENQIDDIKGALPEFKFEQLEQKSTAQAETVVEPTSTFDQTPQQSPDDVCQTSTIHLNDPLIQFFPELAQMDEVQLDLELSMQYIELGAYDSARILLTKNEALLSDEQREISKNLLNRIAS